MVVKNIIQIGNPLLRKKAKAVLDVKSKKVQQVITDLIDTMRHDHLLGEAAPQIGKSLRIFISEIRGTKKRNAKEKDRLRAYVNPKIIEKSKKKAVGYEGCGSIVHAQLFAPVERPESVVVEALDENGKEFRLKAKGLLARVIQHEYDHLEGVLFTDKIHDWAKIMGQKEYLKMRARKSK